MKYNKDFWNGYIACLFSRQFGGDCHRMEWSPKIDNILHRYHAEIIQIPENFDEYSAPLHELKKEAERKINAPTNIRNMDGLLIYWCEHMLHVLKLGKEIAVVLKDKFEDGLIGYENGIRQIDQEMNWAKEYIDMMGNVNSQLIG